jgi:hypothetical protein
MEVSVRLQDLNFEDEQLKVVHSGKKAFMSRSNILFGY